MPEPRWLSDDEQRVWRAWLRVHAELFARLGRQLQEESGLSHADYAVLVNLSEVPDVRLRPYELQQNLQWEQSRLSHQLRRMQNRGLVTREGCPEDARGAYIVLTDAGQQAIEAAAPGHVEAVRQLFFDAMTPAQVTALGKISQQVLDRLE